MAEHVLISPLGRSPGVVSGTALALSKGDNGHLGNFAITRVIAVGTSHGDVVKADQLLTKLFHETEIKYESHLIEQAELRNDDESTKEFMVTIGQALESVHNLGNTVHVGITGGRSGMGALAALATNVYGADYLWFLWVSEEIEERGRIDKMPKPISLAGNKYLDPTLVDDEYQLVPLPFLNLRPYHPIIKEYYREYRQAIQENKRPQIPETVSPVLQLLIRLGIQRLEDIFPAHFPISFADRVVEMVHLYPAATPDMQEELRDELMRMLGPLTDRATIERLKRLLESGGSPEMVFQIGQRAQDPQGFWQWAKENKAVLVATGISTTDMLINAILLWLQATGQI